MSIADTSSRFQDDVSKAIDAGLRDKLAKRFEVAPSTVDQWANGTDEPHPLLCSLIQSIIPTLLVTTISFDEKNLAHLVDCAKLVVAASQRGNERSHEDQLRTNAKELAEIFLVFASRSTEA